VQIVRVCSSFGGLILGGAFACACASDWPPASRPAMAQKRTTMPPLGSERRPRLAAGGGGDQQAGGGGKFSAHQWHTHAERRGTKRLLGAE